MSVVSPGSQHWRLTGFYGHPEASRRGHSWSMLRRLSGMSSFPWICLGDFNEVLDVSEKVGGLPKDWKFLAGFREALDDCGLEDLGFCGPQFTWCNKREGVDLIMERLDRCTGSLDWKMLFPNFEVSHRDFWWSDHCPIIMDCKDNLASNVDASRRRRFHFEECWVEDPACSDLISKTWVDYRSSNSVEAIVSNIHDCGHQLEIWNNHCKRRLKEVINIKKLELCFAYDNIRPGSWKSIQMIESQLDKALEIEEHYWR